MAWAGLRFGDAQRTCPSWTFGALAFGFSLRPPNWGWGHVYFSSLRGWHSQMVDLGGRNLVIDYLIPQIVYYHNMCAVAVANHSNGRALPQMHNARMTPLFSMVDVYRFVLKVVMTRGERQHASNLMFNGLQKDSALSQRRTAERAASNCRAHSGN